MRSLLIVGQMRPDTLRHHQDETAIIHVQPIAAPNKLIAGVTCERAGYRVHYQDRVDRNAAYITFTGSASSLSRSYSM